MDEAGQEVLRLILQGGSVIDWRRLHFRDLEEVDRFLHLHLLDREDPRDEARIRAILSQAVAYLRSAYGYRVAAAVAEPEDLRTLFLLASGVAEPSRYRRIACVVLKVMHVVHHVEARELLFRTPMREADLADRVERRVMAVARRMAEAGLPVVEFQGNRKSRDSLVTKLLVKRESVAAQVFDRVRYRVLTRTEADVVPVLRYLSEQLFPFNYVVPGQSENSLLPVRKPGRGKAKRDNPFSEASYRALHFVVDLPVRIDDLLPPVPPGDGEDLGRIVFSMVELQVMDEETARRNEQGAANHRRYKKRQAVSALRRLSRGLVVPRKRKTRV
ncbi:MAG: hypothetical protein H6Q88_3271 [Anaeromyxobacteraceae bacterium]|nr:hypothetical protein [Anaeromyxobacteraceae bacterium]